MGVLDMMGDEGLYSSEPPYYTYGAPQESLQPARPQQGTQLAPQQQPAQIFAKGGEIRRSLDALRSKAMPDPARVQPERPAESAPDRAALPEESSVDVGFDPQQDPFVEGPGTGRSDSIKAELSDGEYVFDAETVALLGDGSSKAGARQLDALRERIRSHKGAALAKGKFSPDAKRADQYLGGK
jgi:hypothetical protein